VVERGPDGRPILVQYGKSGERMVVQGAQPKADYTTLNLGGTTRLVDTSQLTGPQEFRHTMTPGEAANLDVARQRLALDQYDIKETPQGFAYVPKLPSVKGGALPVVGANGLQLQGANAGQASEDERKAAGFYLRMQQSNRGMMAPATDAQGYPILGPEGKPLTLEDVAGKPGFAEAAAGLTPFLGGSLERSAARTAGPHRLLYRQNQENWVTANLRPESGAVIGPAEMENEIRKYFPQYGDPPEVVAQKARSRLMAEAALQARAGRALSSVQSAYSALTGAANAPAAPQLQNVQGQRPLMWDPKTRTFK
jgi:hypothetical protein